MLAPGRPFATVSGVDFSGAALAGRTAWVAQLDAVSMTLLSLDSLEKLCGDARREVALPGLVDLIRRSEEALWAIDFPFGIPLELMAPHAPWSEQLDLVRQWPDGAYAFGLWCLARAKSLGGRGHIHRATDVAARTPFSCYHYRIIYQTFHGMRDVLAPLARDAATAIMPFHVNRLPRARRAVVEACPSSTLKRLGLPFQRYKQPAGKTVDASRQRVRHVILAALREVITLSPSQRRTIMTDPGGDALDALIAAVGAIQAWQRLSPQQVADPRARREGLIYY